MEINSIKKLKKIQSTLKPNDLLSKSVMLWYKDGINYAIYCGADVNIENGTLLKHAIKFKDIEIIKICFEKKIVINDDIARQINSSITFDKECIDVIKIFINYCSSYNEEFLETAYVFNRNEIFNYLLDKVDIKKIVDKTLKDYVIKESRYRKFNKLNGRI